MAPKMTEDEIDDLLYFARTGDKEEFDVMKIELCKRENVSVVDLLQTARDEHSGNGILHMAAANGHHVLLNELCKELSGSSPQNPTMLSILNTQNNAGNTALHWAALNGHLESVKVLLDHGSDPTITNQRGHDAVFEAELNDKQNVVEWVLKEGGAGLEAGIAGEIAEGEAEGDGDEETDNMDEDVADDELSKQVAKELGQLGLEGKGNS